MKQLFRIVAAVVAVFTFLSSAVAVAEIPSNAVIVTATRTPVTADDALAAVTVITREDIQQRQPQDLLELLRTETGIDISRTGGPGGTTNLFMRGTNSKHVLVLVDGVRAASATTGTFEWRSMSLSQIERIEIVRGPRASLYGADAVGGVVHIFTRQPRGPSVAVGGGSFGTRFSELAYGGGTTVRGGVTASYFGTNGFSAQNEDGGSFDPDDDGYRSRNVSASLIVPLGEDSQFELRGWRAEDDIEFDIGESDLVNETLGAKLTGKLTSGWSHALSLGYTLDDLDTQSSFPSHIATHRRTADWQHDVAAGTDQLLTIGLSYQKDAASNRDPSSDTTLFDKETNNRGIFALWQANWKPLDVQLSARHDDHSVYGGYTTGSAALGGKVSPVSRLWVSYGRAFSAPTLNDLYHPGFGGFFAGNPDLRPERSGSVEIGYSTAPSTSERVAINLFHTKVDDLIDFAGANFQLINVNRASMRGLELKYDLTHERWRYHLGATFQRARDDDTGSELLRRPDTKLTTRIQRDLDGGGGVGAEIVLSSDAADFSNRIDGYGLLNLSAQWPLSRDLRLQGRIENLLDKEYQLVDGYNTVSRSVFVTLRYEPRPGEQ